MFNLPTKRKLALARLLSRAIRAARSAAGLQSAGLVRRRRGARWSLDLAEGIDLSIFLFGAFELATQRAISRLLKPGATVLDIGANVGAYTIPLASMVGDEGQVIAIEPTIWAYDKLLRNLALNPDLGARVRPLRAVLTTATGSGAASYCSSWSLDGSEPGEAWHGGVLRSAAGARALSLDALVAELQLDRIDFIKLDVDGGEIDVLRGAVASLQRFRPPMALELYPDLFIDTDASWPGLISFLESMRYSLFSVHGRRLPLDAAFLRRIIPRGGGINVIALPAQQDDMPRGPDAAAD